MKDEVLSDPRDSDSSSLCASGSRAHLSPRCPDSFIGCQVIIRVSRAESKFLLFCRCIFRESDRGACGGLSYAQRAQRHGTLHLRLPEFSVFSVIHFLLSLSADLNQADTRLALQLYAAAFTVNHARVT